MSQVEALIDLFERKGGRLTLGEILSRWDIVGAKYTGRISDAREALRIHGKTISLVHKDVKHPSNNVYEVVPIVEGKKVVFA